MKNSKFKIQNSGFTLVEMVIAFGVFSSLMVVSTGSFITLMEANHKAQATKTVVNNLHFALENMSRNIRTGRNFHCGAGGILSQPQNCASLADSYLAVTSPDNKIVSYYFNADRHWIEKSVAGGEFIPITAPEITVETLEFFVDGACDPTLCLDTKQPRVLIIVGGVMQGKSKVTSRFDIQTTVSQRALDF